MITQAEINLMSPYQIEDYAIMNCPFLEDWFETDEYINWNKEEEDKERQWTRENYRHYNETGTYYYEEDYPESARDVWLNEQFEIYNERQSRIVNFNRYDETALYYHEEHHPESVVDMEFDKHFAIY